MLGQKAQRGRAEKTFSPVGRAFLVGKRTEAVGESVSPDLILVPRLPENPLPVPCPQLGSKKGSGQNGIMWA